MVRVKQHGAERQSILFKRVHPLPGIGIVVALVVRHELEKLDDAAEDDMTALLTESPPRTEIAAVLGPGQVFFSRTPATVLTFLTSGVAVALQDRESGAGGMSHYLLPRGTGSVKSAKYGDFANALLLAQFRRAGIPAARLEAMIFGGACAIEVLRRRGDDPGAQNVAAGRAFLFAHGIAIIAEDVRGTRGLRVRFHTENGSAIIRRLED